MVQIINDPGRAAGFGRSLGSGISSGLSSALEQLAHQKIQGLHRGQTAKGLEAFGISPEEALQLSYLDPSLLKVFAQNKLQQPYNEAYAQSLSQILGSPMGGQEMGAQQPENFNEFLAQAPEEAPISQAEQLGINGAIGQKPQAQQQMTQRKPVIPALKPEQATKLAELQLQKERIAQKEREVNAKERRELDKESKTYYDQVYKEGEAARKGVMRLDRMEQLIKSGKLDNATVSSVVDFFQTGIPFLGISADLSSVLSPESQEFKKLSTDFLKEAKDIFGARLTNADIQYFLKTIPTLAQSNEGKQRVINNLKSFYEGSILKKDIAKKIIKENGGKRPINLQELVDEQAEPILDEMARQFKSGEKLHGKEVPKDFPLIPGIGKALFNLVT